MVTTFTSPATACMISLPLTCKGETNKNLNCGGYRPKFTPTSGLQKKRHIQACLKISGAIVDRISSPTESQKNELVQRPLNNGKPRVLDDHISSFPDNGKLLEGGLRFQQHFTVRSFEIGSDFKISIQTLINYLQEASLNHVKLLGIVLADGFGSTLKMSAEDLIWVICWSQYDVDYYPSWDDVVQVNSWMYRTGKNGFRRDWHLQDPKTGRTFMRATSKYAMMNKKTRRFAKATEEAIEDLNPYFSQCNPIIDKDSRNLVHLDTNNSDIVRPGLTPGWTDMDVNQHVSHIKLVNYILEGAPRSIVNTHQLATIILEYRKECYGDSVLESLSKPSSDTGSSLMDNHKIQFDHMLRLESGSELVRARTTWSPKYTN